MKIFPYSCEWCREENEVAIEHADGGFADASITKILKTKKCDECARLGAAQSEEFDRRRALMDAAACFADNKSHLERLNHQLRICTRSLKLLADKIAERQGAKLIKPEKVGVDTVPEDRLPF